MAKRFRTCSFDQPFLLPPSLQDWLPESHLARVLADVVSELDLSPITADYERKNGRGWAAYHPELMTRLLFYAYVTGQPSSRQIEQATYDHLAFRYLAANQHPDHDTIATFRRRHLPALAELFVQVLRLCEKAGLVKLGHVAIDGTKIKANASRQASASHERLREREQYWQQTVDRLLAQAEQTDQSEQTQPAQELPEDLADAQHRLAKIRAAKQALEEEARQKRKEAEQAFDEVRRPRSRSKKGDQRPAPDPVEYEKRKQRYHRAKAQAEQPTRKYNFTDPDSRVMFDNGPKAFVQGYNAQAAVDSAAQIIVAAAVTQQVVDREQLVPMVEQVRQVLAQMAGGEPEQAPVPKVISADTGYWDTASLKDPALAGIDVLVPPQAATDNDAEDTTAQKEQSAAANRTIQQMRERLASAEGAAEYAQRGQTVEPVFGQIKERRGFRRFLLRGLAQVEAEWILICLTHNLGKLCQHRRAQKAGPAARRGQRCARNA